VPPDAAPRAVAATNPAPQHTAVHRPSPAAPQPNHVAG
jgi:hypothetical protein